MHLEAHIAPPFMLGNKMPLYDFIDEKTQQEEQHLLRIAELELFLENNPHLKQKLSAPGYADSVRLGITKTPESFNHLVKNIKKRYHGSTIETR